MEIRGPALSEKSVSHVIHEGFFLVQDRATKLQDFMEF